MMKKITIMMAAMLLATPVLAQETSEIVERCRQQMGEYGAAMVKACADRDIEASGELASYPAGSMAIVERCRQQMGEYGAAMVKACADRDIEADAALRGYGQ